MTKQLGIYTIYSNGKVWSNKHNKFLKPSKDEKGYLRIGLYLNGKAKTYKLHRLISECFINKIEGKTQINHKDCNKLNNDISNLEWCNNSENQKHHHRVIKTGYLFGMKNHKAKITEQQMKEIRAKYATHKYTQTQLADEYNITQSAVSQIISNKIRKYN